MDLQIKRKPGGFHCFFSHKGQEYIGSLTYQTNYLFSSRWAGTECIIFKSVDKQITFENALGECMSRDCEFSPDALRERIEDFIKYN